MTDPTAPGSEACLQGGTGQAVESYAFSFVLDPHHLADRFEPRLTHLDKARDRQVPLAFLDNVCRGAEELDPARPAKIPPRRKGRHQVQPAGVMCPPDGGFADRSTSAPDPI